MSPTPRTLEDTLKQMQRQIDTLMARRTLVPLSPSEIEAQTDAQIAAEPTHLTVSSDLVLTGAGTRSDPDNLALSSRLASSFGTPITDCNTALLPGWYAVSSTAANRPSGAGSLAAVCLLVIAQGLSVRQHFYHMNGTGIADGLWYYRDSTSSGAWTAWVPAGLKPTQVNSSTSTVNGTVILSWSMNNDYKSFDSAGLYSSGSPTVLTVKYTGLYRISYHVRTTGTVGISVNFQVNGVSDSYLSSSAWGTSGAATATANSFDLQLNAGDQISLQVVSTSSVSSQGSTLTVELVG